MSFAGEAAQRRLLSHEELVERGVSRREASRIVVRASLQQVIEATFAHLARFWLCAVALLTIVMFVVLVWSQAVYAARRSEQCDMPLAAMLRLICFIVAFQGCQSELARCCLCYDMARDGPVEPARVRVFRCISILAAVAWPVAATVMLVLTRKCDHELELAVMAIVACYGALALVLVIAPAFFLTVVLCLVRRGLIRLPRNPAAAPEGFAEQLPVVEFDARRFSDEGAPGEFPSTCPVCLEAFSADGVIRQTRCGHVFHGGCLGGWLQVARSCPLCRQDLTNATAAEERA